MQYNRFVFVIFADDLSHHVKLSLDSLPITYYEFIETEDVHLKIFDKYISEKQPDFHLGISRRHRYAMRNSVRINILRSEIYYPALSQAMIIDLEHESNKRIRQRISRDNKISTILK